MRTPASVPVSPRSHWSYHVTCSLDSSAPADSLVRGLVSMSPAPRESRAPQKPESIGICGSLIGAAMPYSSPSILLGNRFRDSFQAPQSATLLCDLVWTRAGLYDPHQC